MIKKGLLIAMGLAAAINAQAASIAVDNNWNSFAVDELVDPSLTWIDEVTSSPLSFDITLTTMAYLMVVDAGFSGDEFEVFDNGISLGFTSTASNNYVDGSTPTVIDFDAAWTQSNFSKGTFLLTPGSHSITGLLSTSAVDTTNTPFNATLGAVKLTAVPEPFTNMLLLMGGAMFAAVRRQRTQPKI